MTTQSFRSGLLFNRPLQQGLAFGSWQRHAAQARDDQHEEHGACCLACAFGAPQACAAKRALQSEQRAAGWPARDGRPPTSTGRAAGRITPAGQPCAFGAHRLSDGTCPGDSEPSLGGHDLGAAQEVPPGWDRMGPDARAEWARNYAREQRLSAAEAARLEEESRTATRQMITGFISEGMSLLRTLIETRSSEHIAEVRADAAVRGARLTGDRDSEQAILDSIRTGGGGGSSANNTNRTGGVTGKKSGAGTALGLLGLALLLAK